MQAHTMRFGLCSLKYRDFTILCAILKAEWLPHDESN